MLDRIRSARPLALVAGAVLAVVTACGNPLEVETTSRIPAENIEIPANAQLLVSGSIADFECAFAAYVVQSATVGEEFIYAQQTADRVPSDRRSTLPTDGRYATNSCVGLGIYTPLQTARQSSETALNYLKSWSDAEVANRTKLIAYTSAYAGYSYLLMGEGFCTLAFSSINPDRSIAYGGEVSRDSAFKLAIARFTESIAAAQAVPNPTAGVTDSLRLAYLGRARARLNLGDYAGAKADAQQIPAGYVRNATYSTAVSRRSNFVFDDNSAANISSSVGEPYRSMAGDPRVPVTQGTSTSATGIRHWYQSKYTSSAAPIPFAKYQEAQLIIAEAEIRSNNLPAALPILNAERARGNQGVFVGVTQADYLAELVSQRRRELFLEGQHLGDIIRYNIPVQPVAGTPYHFGG
ncbi:MAG TPA: RagB/SusD family nutrient uptake outer membrane protein, partial [Gemmatimonadaceae bacterium]|nr:RagB/SusD family nutrient uptake outer membrane protein [Gemmatimonadaceae bacterium]